METTLHKIRWICLLKAYLQKSCRTPRGLKETLGYPEPWLRNTDLERGNPKPLVWGMSHVWLFYTGLFLFIVELFSQKQFFWHFWVGNSELQHLCNVLRLGEQSLFWFKSATNWIYRICIQQQIEFGMKEVKSNGRLIEQDK